MMRLFKRLFKALTVRAHVVLWWKRRKDPARPAKAKGYHDLTYYPDAETFGMPRRETPSEAAGAPQSNASADEDSRYLFVVSDAPEAVYRASYRALVRLYHPDVNGAVGDNRQIQDLNAAWERIRAKKGWT